MHVNSHTHTQSYTYCDTRKKNDISIDILEIELTCKQLK